MNKIADVAVVTPIPGQFANAGIWNAIISVAAFMVRIERQLPFLAHNGH